MREAKAAMIVTRGTLDPRGEGRLLGHLGTEIASLYRDTLLAPLPANLQAIVDRLERSMTEADRKSGHSR
jgi:hypothetical protein